MAAQAHGLGGPARLGFPRFTLPTPGLPLGPGTASAFAVVGVC